MIAELDPTAGPAPSAPSVVIVPLCKLQRRVGKLLHAGKCQQALELAEAVNRALPGSFYVVKPHGP